MNKIEWPRTPEEVCHEIEIKSDITYEREKFLCILYELARHKTAWLQKLVDCGITENDEAFLVWLDEHEADINKRSRNIVREMEDDDSEEMGKVLQEIWRIETEHIEMRRDDKDWFERNLMLWAVEYEKLCKRRDRLQRRFYYKINNWTSEITTAQIERARAFPLAELFEVPRSKMINCPFHNDKTPSMKVNGSYAWCFGCSAWMDSIKYLMHIKNMNFVEAIRRLI